MQQEDYKLTTTGVSVRLQEEHKIGDFTLANQSVRLNSNIELRITAFTQFFTRLLLMGVHLPGMIFNLQEILRD